MADNMAVEETQWFSAELRILEAEYEKSKLQVFQDTLLCKRSMIELELLCKNEQLQKTARVNNRMKKQESELQEQLKSLSTELKCATSQLQTAQDTLEGEKAHHDLEKKELEEKLNLEMERKVEEQRNSASNKENVLHEEIKKWQDKHVKSSKEAEDLRMELNKKNVAVKTKAVQTRVTVEDASTMAQIDHQTAEVGIQVQELALNEGSRKIDEVIQATSESCKGRKTVMESTKKDDNKRKGKDCEQETDLKNGNKKVRKKGKKFEKGKGNEKIKDKEKNEKPKASQKIQSVSTRQERAAPPNEVSVMSEKQEKLHDGIKAGDAWLVSNASQEDDVPLQCSKSPRLRKKSDENNHSFENSTETSDIMNTCTSVDTQALMAETNTGLNKHCEVLAEGISQLAVCLKDTENERTVKGDEEVREAGLNEENVKNDKEDSVRISKQGSVKEQQSHVLMEEREEGGFESKMSDTFEDVQGKGSKRVRNVKERNRKIKEKRENTRTKKTKKVALAEKKISQDENSVENENGETKREGKVNENLGGRVLRSRTKKRSSEVEIHPCKGHREDRNDKSLDKQSRQIPHDSDQTVATKKHKTDDSCLKGHEPAMLLTSSPEDHQCPHENELSSHEINTLVDEARPLRGVKTRATTDDTSQRPETEIQRELKGENKKAAQSERLGDFNPGQGSLVLDDNRIREVGEKINRECLYSSLEEVKSGRSSSEENGNKKSNNEKTELSPKKSKRSIKQTRKKVGCNNDADVSMRQDSSAIDPRDNHTRSTGKKAKSTTSDNARWKRKRQNPTEQPAVKVSEKTDATLKENAPNATTEEKKRKPTSSVRGVLAPADQSSSADGTTSTEISSMLDNTKKRKTLFNARENSLMVSVTKAQVTFANTTLSKSRPGNGIPPSLSAFMRSFIAPKLKKSF